MSIPTAPIAAGSLIGGYLVARESKVRALGGVVLAAGAVVAANQWRKTGPVTAVALTGIYLTGFGASHPLAKKIGAWPAVFTAAGVSGGASWLLHDRRR